MSMIHWTRFKVQHTQRINVRYHEAAYAIGLAF